MKILKKSQIQKPKVSLILLDWSVRESFHLLHYLSLQTLPRDEFEVIIIEYYSTESEAIKKFDKQVDTWVLLDMPKNAYYHKHLMYNAGIIFSQGEYVIVCDSDAMAKPTFLQSIVDAFQEDPDIVLHLDQFRNNRRDFYPFNYPSFEDVLGRGCINNENGVTTGLAVKEDLIHNRNYGACFCAKRSDLIEIGGADEHIDFIGHICGPYDFTFRLINLDRKEVWHDSEFLYHTWHPGQAGDNNYLGPHDGRHVSTTSLEALYNMRVEPHVINPLIEKERKGLEITLDDLNNNLILPIYEKITEKSFLESKASRDWAEQTYKRIVYNGFNIINEDGCYFAIPKIMGLNNSHQNIKESSTYRDSSLLEIKNKIDNHFSVRGKVIPSVIMSYIILARMKFVLKRRLVLLKNGQDLYIKSKTSSILESRLFKKVKAVSSFFYRKASSCRSLYCKVISKLKQARTESVCFWDDIKVLFVSIEGASKISKNPIQIVTASAPERTCLYIANKLKLIPKVQVLQVNNQFEVDEFLGALSQNEESMIFLSRQIYVEYLLRFRDAVKNHQIHVI